MVASEEELLLRAILDSPEPDGPRLAYADACARRGDEDRAEFIRLQCELAHMNWGEPRGRPLYERMTALLQAHFDEWTGTLRPVVAPAGFWRGFIESAHGSPQALLAHADSLNERTPLEQLRLIDYPESVDDDYRRLVAHPLLERVRDVRFTETAMGAEGVRLLLSSPRLRRLETLHLGDEECTPGVARVVSDLLPLTVKSLGFLGFEAATFDDGAARALAESPRLAGLETLLLYNCNLGPEGARSLGRSEHLVRLENLFLGLGQPTGNDIQTEGARALASAVFLPALVELDLDFNTIADEGLSALVDSGRFQKLRYLHLQANALTDVSVQRLCASPVMKTLEMLDLRSNRLGPASAEVLARANPPRLTTLWLPANSLSDEGVRALARSPWLAQLRELNLDGTGMSDLGAEELLRSPYVNSIRKLICLNNRLSDPMERRLIEKFGSRLVRSSLSPMRPA